jgi:hypothetical protein
MNFKAGRSGPDKYKPVNEKAMFAWLQHKAIELLSRGGHGADIVRTTTHTTDRRA